MNSQSRRQVLITGGFGFIGSHLTERLLCEPGTYVHVVDNLSTSPIEMSGYLSRLHNTKRLSHDICTVGEFFSNLSIPQFDEVYHLASVVGPVGVLKHGGQILRSIVDDTSSVAGYALRSGARLCDVSTSEVYGGGRAGYCSETDSMIIPSQTSVRLEYAVAKLGAEVAMKNMARMAGLQVAIVRPFNVAGPRQSPAGGFVLPRFVNQALAGEALTVYGDGSMIRAFTHVRDIVDGIILALRRGQPGEAYNIGNPANRTTILELARKVIKATGSNSRVSFVDPKKLWGPLFEEANDKYPDAHRAADELGWFPRVDLERIICETARYIREKRCD